MQPLMIAVSKKSIQNVIQSWKNQLEILSLIAEIQTYSYSAYTCGFKHKLRFFLQTVTDIDECLRPIEETLRLCFILK